MRNVLFFAGLLVLSTAVGCKSKFEKLRASNNTPLKYQEAIKYYDNKKYSKAQVLFEDLSQRYRGQAEAEDLTFYSAYTSFRLRDYTTARYHFGQFASGYPNSHRAEEARYMSAYCLYLESPRYSLDQEYTFRAIEAMQLFINLYPESDRVATAENHISELRDRLEKKSFLNARQYLDMGLMDDYRAAVVAFDSALRDFPDSKYAEEMEFLSIKAQYLYGINSTVRRQQERLEEAIDLYNRFAINYPESKFMGEADALKKESESKIDQAKKKIKEVEEAIANAERN